MNGAFSLILGLSLAGGATGLAVFAAGLSFRKHIKKSWLIYLWLVVLLRFIIPVPLNLPFVTGGINSNVFNITAEEPAPAPVPADTLGVPDSISNVTDQSVHSALTDPNASASAMPDDVSASAVPDNAVTAHNPGIATGIASNPSNAADTGTAPAGTVLLGILPYLWLFGASLMLIWTVTGYTLTMLKLRRGRRLLIQGRVPVYETSGIMTPILAGILRPAIYLPAGFPNRALAIQHELTHFRRGDIWLKWFVQLTVCVHWFNPLAWLMKRELNRLCELACDSAVIRHLNPSEQHAYGQMLLDTAHAVTDRSGVLVASLGKDKRFLTERIIEIVTARKTTKKAVTAITALTAVILISAVLFGAFLSACKAPSTAGGDPTGSPLVTEAVAAGGSATGVPQGFVNDPEVIGTWEPFNFTHSISDFVPSEKNYPYSSYNLIFAPDGTTSTPNMTWTKGTVMNADYGITGDYTIREIDGTKYLFLGQGDNPVDYLGETYEYVVYKWASENAEFTLYTDDIDLPFEDDPAVHGTWRCVSYAVSSDTSYMSKGMSIDFYDTSSPFSSDYANTEMTFSEGGALRTTEASGGTQPVSRELSWTKGAVINLYPKTASAYELREISGTTFLFIEYKGESYTRIPPESRLLKTYTVWVGNPEPAPSEMNLPEGSLYSFINDPALVGTWMPYGLAKNDFEFSAMWREGYAFVAYANGRTNEPNMTWSKGSLTLFGNYEAEDLVRDYIIREIGGRRFLFVRPLASSAASLAYYDYKYTVYLWVSEPVPDAIYTDDIDLPFVNDPAVLGTWKLTASARSIDDDKPLTMQYATYLPQETMTFADGGSLRLITAGTPAPAGFSWTKGAVIDPYLKTASAYEFREIDGVTYLFMERKDIQNYTHLHVIGGYTVWRKIN